MEEEQIKVFADSLWDYLLEKKLKQYLSDSVCYYMASVVEPASDGFITVQRPFDNPVTLPCGANAESLAVGDACAVLVFGDFSNQIVIGNVAELTGKITITDATETTLNGVLAGNGATVEAIPVDSVPTAGSTNLVESGGVDSAIEQAGDFSKPYLIADGTDLNSLTAPGCYRISTKARAQTLVNAPWPTNSSAAQAFVMFIIRNPLNLSNTTYFFQVIITATTVWTRRHYESTWEPWVSQKDLDTATTTLSGVLAGNGSSVEVMPVDSVPTVGSTNLVTSGGVQSALTRPNLLDNWFFAGGGSQLGEGIFPINSRGLTSTSGAALIDRWYTSNNYTTKTLQSDGFKVAHDTATRAWLIYQDLIVPDPVGKTFTASILVKEVSGTKSRLHISFMNSANSQISAPYSSYITAAGLYQITAEAPANTAKLRVGLYPGSAPTVGDYVLLTAAKLELGDTQTLAHQESGEWVLNELPDYEEQLIRCRSNTANPNDSYANDQVAFQSELANQTHKSLGAFSTLAELSALLDAELAEMKSDSESHIKVNATATIAPFLNYYAYEGTLYKGNNNVTYSSAVLYPLGHDKAVLCRRDQTYGWYYEAIATNANVSNPNLVNNWYFIGGGSQAGAGNLPINQRSNTTYTSGSSEVVGIDLWRFSRGTVTIESDHINYTSVTSTASYKRFIQRTGIPISAGTPLTISMLARVNSLGGSVFMRVGNGSSGITGGTFQLSTTTDYELFTHTFTPDSDISNMAFDILVNNTAASAINIDIKAVKIEIGVASTLAHKVGNVWVLNEIPNYEEQLIRCKTSTADSSDTYANDPVVFQSALDTKPDKARFNVPANSSIQLNISASSSGLIFSTSSTASAKGLYATYNRTSGTTTTVDTAVAASGLSLTASSGVMTVTNSAAYGAYIFIIAVSGDLPTLVS